MTTWVTWIPLGDNFKEVYPVKCGEIQKTLSDGDFEDALMNHISTSINIVNHLEQNRRETDNYSGLHICFETET